MKLTQTIDASLNNPKSKLFPLLNDFLAFITLVSIAALVLETVPELKQYHPLFMIVEYVCVGIFTAEYIVRVLSAPVKRKYIFSFYGLIDLVAILPTLVSVANLSFLKSARMIRIIRLLRMVRLAKLVKGRGKRSGDIETHHDIFSLNIQIYIFTLLTAIVALGTLFYVAEAPSQHLNSIPEGMLWAAEAIVGGSVMGYYPQTLAGIIVAILARFTGLILLGMLVSVVGNVIRVWLLGEDLTKNERRSVHK